MLKEAVAENFPSTAKTVTTTERSDRATVENHMENSALERLFFKIITIDFRSGRYLLAQQGPQGKRYLQRVGNTLDISSFQSAELESYRTSLQEFQQQQRSTV